MNNLGRIVKQHLKPKGPMPTTTEMKCKDCGESFKNKYSLANHVRWNHKGKGSGPRGLVTQHYDILKQMARDGTGAVLREHPEWKELLLGKNGNMQKIYQAVSVVRNKEGAGSRGSKSVYWTAEQYQLARSIIASPQWKDSDGDVNWARVFSVHPEWRQALNYTRDNPRFASFIARVRQGAGKNATGVAPVAPAVNGNGSSHVQIGGREYDLLELEQIVKAHQNALAPLKFCPECGTNLLMHTKAYSIAKRHTQEG